MTKQNLLQFFDTKKYYYTLHEHEPVFTVEQGHHLFQTIPGAHSKNLFLKDRKDSLILVSILDHKRLDLKGFSKQLGLSGLSFASAERLKETLQLLPGSVTPFGLFHESAREVRFFLDTDFLEASIVNFHPLQNDSTVSMCVKSFMQFFADINHPVEVVTIPCL